MKRAGDGYVVEDTSVANRLHNKYRIGDPQPGNTLVLDPVEAAYGLEKRWLDGIELADALEDVATQARFLVYRDLRERGLTARISSGDPVIRVWARGEHPPSMHASTVHAHDERVPLDARELSHAPLHAVADEDGAVTYYMAKAAEPTGDAPAMTATEGRVVGNRVLASDPAGAAGTPVAGEHLINLHEAKHLESQGLAEFPGLAGAVARPGFATVQAVYDDLRNRGTVPKSGFRFGTHLRAYSGHPDAGHAEWLIHAQAAGEPLDWTDVARGVRLAHGVRKQFLVAIAEPASDVTYWSISWHRP